MKKILTFILCTLFAQIAFAQTENNDFMRSVGKIYVVVATLGCIFAGIVWYLINLDRKFTKLENQIIKKNE